MPNFCITVNVNTLGLILIMSDSLTLIEVVVYSISVWCFVLSSAVSDISLGNFSSSSALIPGVYKTNL